MPRRTVRVVDPDKLRRIDAQSETIAELLDVDPESVMHDPHYGVLLSVDQADRLIALAREGAQRQA